MRKRSGQVHSRESSATLQLTVSLLYPSIEFKLPIIEKEFTLSLDNDAQNECVIMMQYCRKEKK